jgi:tRNA uridine 5-carboxymethylaminomethyl modification enzyme
MYTGVIEGIGPRYCPSIEDKVVRFADRDSHQIFVEPEGLESAELYPNGISTSLPFDVQFELVRSIRGFEQAHITRPGYAIEYDYFDPRSLRPSLETQAIGGLFFAGQINGTTGYEEAAAQGLIAGLNAARQASDLEPWCPTRDQAYIGVMIDDLISRGTSEPYRMFTSRAEYRLLLREDNADLRLTEQGRELGLVDDERWACYARKCEQIERLQTALEGTRLRPSSPEAADLAERTGAQLQLDSPLLDLMKRSDISAGELEQSFPDLFAGFDEAVKAQIEIRAKYAGYIDRQQNEIERTRRYEHWRVPAEFDFRNVVGLSNEVREKLQQRRPATLGQASRIPGVTPAAVTLLIAHIRKASA